MEEMSIKSKLYVFLLLKKIKAGLGGSQYGRGIIGKAGTRERFLETRDVTVPLTQTLYYRHRKAIEEKLDVDYVLKVKNQHPTWPQSLSILLHCHC